MDNTDGSLCGYVSRDTFPTEGTYQVTIDEAASLQVRFTPKEGGLAYAEILVADPTRYSLDQIYSLLSSLEPYHK